MNPITFSAHRPKMASTDTRKTVSAKLIGSTEPGFRTVELVVDIAANDADELMAMVNGAGIGESIVVSIIRE